VRVRNLAVYVAAARWKNKFNGKEQRLAIRGHCVLSRLNVRRSSMGMEIRIIALPAGEAPELVRRGWVGTILPLADGESGPRTLRMWGVLSGPRTFVSSLWHLLTRQYTWEYGYVVDAPRALQILEQLAPEAARWWQENTPYWQPGKRLIFNAAVCEELKGLGGTG
jgi:hypothetical protein